MQTSSKTILVTQPVELREEFVTLLKAEGLDVYNFPALELDVLADNERQSLRKPLLALNPSEWLVFTSKTGVHQTFSIAPELIGQGNEIAVVGEKTAKVLEGYTLKASVIAEIATSEGLADALINRFAGKTKPKLILCRGARSNKALPILLEEAGFAVESIIVYRTKTPVVSVTERLELAKNLGFISGQAAKISVITALSSDTLSNLVKLLGQDSVSYKTSWQESLLEIPLVVIGSKTAATAEKYGFKQICVSEEPAIESVVEMIAGL